MAQRTKIAEEKKCHTGGRLCLSASSSSSSSSSLVPARHRERETDLGRWVKSNLQCMLKLHLTNDDDDDGDGRRCDGGASESDAVRSSDRWFRGRMMSVILVGGGGGGHGAGDTRDAFLSHTRIAIQLWTLEDISCG